MASKKQYRDLGDFLVDPDFSGAFPGGPPLLTQEHSARVLEHPEEVEAELMAGLRNIWDEEDDE